MGSSSQSSRRPAAAEAKFSAWPGFRLPELTGVLPFVVASDTAEHRLDAWYYDAPDLRLIRAGITVRFRRAVGAGQGRWTMKLPDPNVGAVGRMHEVGYDSETDSVPPAFTDALRGVARSVPLVVVAHLQTQRRLVWLRDQGGRLLGEVCDDEVSVFEDDRIAARFREVVVELAPGAPDTVLAAVGARLTEAGAGAPDPLPKLARALGPRAQFAADPLVPPLPKGPTAGQVVQYAFAVAVRRLLAHDPVIRLDLGPAGVHQARVSTRRLRSDLRTFAPLIDGNWAAGFADDLTWLAGVLGACRDLDVLGERIAGAVARLDRPDARHAEGVLDVVRRQRTAALADVHRALDSPRYASLLDRLVEAACTPRLDAIAAAPAAQVLPGLVVGPWNKLRKDVRNLDRNPPDAALHAVRIRAKRVRYAAEAVAPAVPAATPFALAVTGVQTVLGDHQDAVVAEGWLRSVLEEGCAPSTAFAAGLLVADQRAEQDRHRAEFPAAWDAASKPKLRSWLP